MMQIQRVSMLLHETPTCKLAAVLQLVENEDPGRSCTVHLYCYGSITCKNEKHCYQFKFIIF